MSRPVIVLRPEPGKRATIDRLESAGLKAVPLPLFDIVPLTWTAPDPSRFDHLLLTSANAVRHGGPQLSVLQSLPVIAVGEATATAARDAGFVVVATGDSNVHELLSSIAPTKSLLWLCGRERTPIEHAALAAIVPVYTADARRLRENEARRLSGGIALLHSVRAARELASEIDRHAIPRETVRIAALSDKVAAAAGSGWARIGTADTPNDDRLIDVARTLAIDP